MRDGKFEILLVDDNRELCDIVIDYIDRLPDMRVSAFAYQDSFIQNAFQKGSDYFLIKFIKEIVLAVLAEKLRLKLRVYKLWNSCH